MPGPGFGEQMPGAPTPGPSENAAERSLEVREATVEDVPQMQAFYHESWRAMYVREELGITAEDADAHFAVDRETPEATQERWKGQIEDPSKGVKFFVAKEADRVVGFARAAIIADKPDKPGNNHLALLHPEGGFVDPSRAEKLFEQVNGFLRQDRRTVLWVAESSKDEREFYAGKGFNEVGPGTMTVTPEKKIPTLKLERPAQA